MSLNLKKTVSAVYSENMHKDNKKCRKRMEPISQYLRLLRYCFKIPSSWANDGGRIFVFLILDTVPDFT